MFFSHFAKRRQNGHLGAFWRHVGAFFRHEVAFLRLLTPFCALLRFWDKLSFFAVHYSIFDYSFYMICSKNPADLVYNYSNTLAEYKKRRRLTNS